MQIDIAFFTSIIQILSSIILAIFTIGLWWATNEQKNIAKQEKDLHLFKLRMEHYHNFIELWTLYSSYFIEHKDYCEAFLNRKTLENRANDFQRISHELTILSSESAFLYNNEVFNIEKELSKYFDAIVLTDMYDDDLAKDYLNNKKYYNKMIKNVTPILEVGVENAK